MIEFDRTSYEEKFITHLRKRLKDGKIEYGVKSFAGPLKDTILEIQEELADVAGWAFIGWTKLERLRERIAKHNFEDLGMIHEEV